MRFVSFQDAGGGRRVGVRQGDEIVPLVGVEAIGPDTSAELLRSAELDRRAAVPFESATLLPAVAAPQKVICVGLNYGSHIAETKRSDSDYPVLFTKFPGALIGARDDIVRPAEAGFWDYEAELAVVIGTAGRRIPESAALDHVLGYSIANDVTARDYQYKTHQWLQGKAWDASTPLGPDIVTPDEVDPTTSRIRCIVNGKTVQDGDISTLIFPIPYLIATISEFTRLVPGDVILTGTPGGVGYRSEPQLNLVDGDVVTVEIDGLGAITNTVRAESAASLDEPHPR